MSALVVARRGPLGLLSLLGKKIFVFLGAIVLTLFLFLMLPIIQAIGEEPTDTLTVRSIDTALPPPPDEIIEEEELEEEEEEEEPPPELEEELEPIDLSVLESALSGDLGGVGSFPGDFTVDLQDAAGGDGGQGIYSLADLDQRPRATYQPNPILTAKLRKKAPGSVQIIFVVDERGRVKNPKVQSSTDPIFEKPALNAVKQWRFEPGKRKGQPVEFKMRVPVTFPKG